MPSDITVAIADAARTPVMRASLTLSGRVVWFPANKLGSALDSIQLNHPKLVIVDAQVSETPQGQALLERVEQLAIRGSAVRLIVPRGGSWTTKPLRESQDPPAERMSEPPPAITVPAVQTVVEPAAVISTRRAPRFHVPDPMKVVIESADATLVDISTMGAQVISGPILRPNQKVTVALPESDRTVRLTAQIAWSTLQQTAQRPDTHYRAGIEFAETAGKALEDLCRRLRR